MFLFPYAVVANAREPISKSVVKTTTNKDYMSFIKLRKYGHIQVQTFVK
jgi:hypothetical protein